MAYYNIQKMITSGRDVMANNPKREISLIDIARIRESNPDVYVQIENAFLFGVALGVRIGKAEQTEGGRNR